LTGRGGGWFRWYSKRGRAVETWAAQLRCCAAQGRCVIWAERGERTDDSDSDWVQVGDPITLPVQRDAISPPIGSDWTNPDEWVESESDLSLCPFCLRDE
jgi:hypothetical protein